jgi:hypothetical protein
MRSRDGEYQMLIRPRGRHAADEYFHDGVTWIEGREGSNYVIELSNLTPRRVEFVVSVDGLDVYEGKPAGLGSGGYVVAAYQTVQIPGWRLSNQNAAEFYFSRSKDSYVSQIGGSVSNTGVIGAMVFEEQEISPFNTPSYLSPIGGLLTNTRSLQANLAMNNVPSYNSIVSKGATPVQQDVGTGFGASTQFVTSYTTFVRANPQTPNSMLVLYYNTAKNLEKMGIKLRRKNDVSYRADPFPAYSSGVCKPPSGWSG